MSVRECEIESERMREREKGKQKLASLGVQSNEAFSELVKCSQPYYTRKLY